MITNICVWYTPYRKKLNIKLALKHKITESHDTKKSESNDLLSVAVTYIPAMILFSLNQKKKKKEYHFNKQSGKQLNNEGCSEFRCPNHIDKRIQISFVVVYSFLYLYFFSILQCQKFVIVIFVFVWIFLLFLKVIDFSLISLLFRTKFLVKFDHHFRSSTCSDHFRFTFETTWYYLAYKTKKTDGAATKTASIIQKRSGSIGRNHE